MQSTIDIPSPSLFEEPPTPIKSNKKSGKQPSLISRLLVGVFLFTLGAGICGLIAVKNQMYAGWNEALERYQWLVLVQGDQVQNDEVGRFLRQIEGVSNVSFVSPETTLKTFSNDPELAKGLEYVDGNPFPPCWKVTWKAEQLDPAKMQESLQDLKTFPGVMDVAYDRAALQDVYRARVHWYEIKTVISLLVVAGVAFASILLGAVIFSAKKTRFDWGKAVSGLLIDEIFWALGFLAIYQLIGRLSWQILAGGILFSALRQAWTYLSEQQ